MPGVPEQARKESVVQFSNLLAAAERPQNGSGICLARMAKAIKTLRDRRADRLRRRQLDVVPAEILKDIGMTRPQVFAGVPGHLSAARP
ncbi:MAG TPA: hypothetical protein VJ890_00020 [Vineibacter sp.]|nr:hypothetical protein [Vineibacter sp.]